jgi:hypothetical protein
VEFVAFMPVQPDVQRNYRAFLRSWGVDPGRRGMEDDDLRTDLADPRLDRLPELAAWCRDCRGEVLFDADEVRRIAKAHRLAG